MGGVDIGEDQFLAPPCPRDVGPVRADHAGKAAIVELPFAATAINVGQEELVFIGAGGNDDLRYHIEGLHQRCRHDDHVRATQRQSTDIFGKLHVVADQHCDLQSAEIKDRRLLVAGRKLLPVDIAEEMRLAVTAKDGAVGSDGDRRVEDLTVGGAFRKTENQRNADAACDPRGLSHRGAVQRFGQPADGVGADGVAGQKKFRSDKDIRPSRARFSGDALEAGKIARRRIGNSGP